jgi:tripartite-type tricarboxylate transporter receptor subunit TctC
MKTTMRSLGVAAATVALVAGLSACNSTNAAGTGGTPNNVQFIVDTGPGGGSDLFAREIIKIARDEKVLTDNWPVVAKPEGGGLGAMAFLKGKPGDSNFISAFTSKWIIAGQATASAPATMADLTPIVMLADEIQVIAAPADAPFNTLTEFLAAAKANPGEMVQTGGSPNSVDNLVALEIEKTSGTKWKYSPSMTVRRASPRCCVVTRRSTSEPFRTSPIRSRQANSSSSGCSPTSASMASRTSRQSPSRRSTSASSPITSSSGASQAHRRWRPKP